MNRKSPDADARKYAKWSCISWGVITGILVVVGIVIVGAVAGSIKRVTFALNKWETTVLSENRPYPIYNSTWSAEICHMTSPFRGTKRPPPSGYNEGNCIYDCVNIVLGPQYYISEGRAWHCAKLSCGVSYEKQITGYNGQCLEIDSNGYQSVIPICQKNGDIDIYKCTHRCGECQRTPETVRAGQCMGSSSIQVGPLFGSYNVMMPIGSQAAYQWLCH